jgi:hypothetical protein
MKRSPKPAMTILPVIVLLFLFMDGINAFHVKHQQRASTNERVMVNNNNEKHLTGLSGLFSKKSTNDETKKPPVYYNDDAFGLIFLIALGVEKDVPFGSIFGVLSAIVALAVKNDVISFVPLLPGTIATIALILSQVIHAVTGDEHHLGSVLEIATCGVSIGWGLIQQRQQKEVEN